ncbi:hypothetical protein AB9P05_20945 [Roseivirga sp. BDSF3-8]|uniref:hypothetical protein n=1 Tax=Roseivirga sp. BDSF3-8 TaxID=3241598 RepID=UPI003531F18C
MKPYKEFWISFVQIGPDQGYHFNDLIDLEQISNDTYVGAWANIITRAEKIENAIEIIYQGAKEKNMKVLFIDKIENIETLIEYEELETSVMAEIEWLLNSNYVFLISDPIFPYRAGD